MKKIIILLVFALGLNANNDILMDDLTLGKHVGSYLVITKFGRESVNIYYLPTQIRGVKCISYISGGFHTSYCGDFAIMNRRDTRWVKNGT